jgi:hypothetical protein
MRQGKIERIEERRRTGAHRRCQNCPGKPAETSGSDEKFRRPGGTICRGRKGERRGGRGLLIGMARGETAGHLSGLKRAVTAAVAESRERDTWRRSCRQVGPIGQRERERERRGIRFGEERRWAAGRFREWAESDPRGPFPFLFSFLLFFSDFSYLLHKFCINASKQINKFHKFCKVHSKVLNQYQTRFQNQNKVFK